MKMFLKKLADEIRNQNWFTVSIEIMIVVIGIFIGLQVTEWNNNRNANNQNQRFLEQLNKDISSSIKSMEKAIEEHEKFIKKGKVALKFLNKEVPLEKYQTDIEFAFQKMHENPKPQLLHGNLSNLMLGDSWQIITNDEKKIQLRSLTNSLGNQTLIYRDIESKVAEATLLNRQLIGFSIPGDADLSIVFDADKLQNSTRFKVAMQNSIVFHWWASRLLKLMISTLESYKLKVHQD